MNVYWRAVCNVSLLRPLTIEIDDFCLHLNCFEIPIQYNFTVNLRIIMKYSSGSRCKGIKCLLCLLSTLWTSLFKNG